MKARQPKKQTARVSTFPSRQGKERFGMYRLASLVGILLTLCLLLLIGSQSLQHYRLKRELASFDQSIERYTLKSEQLNREIDRLQDFSYLEVLARSRLGLVKPGEIIFQLED